MNANQVKENKARWALFEQVSTTTNAVIWAVIALILVLGAYYLLS